LLFQAFVWPASLIRRIVASLRILTIGISRFVGWGEGMPNYRRNIVLGGTFFFTVTLLERKWDLLVAAIDLLRESVRRKRGERGIWHRRYWEHTIRDDRDFRAHVDYVHINPVKHGVVSRVRDWPLSTFHPYVKVGPLPQDWAGGDEAMAAVSE